MTKDARDRHVIACIGLQEFGPTVSLYSSRHEQVPRAEYDIGLPGPQFGGNLRDDFGRMGEIAMNIDGVIGAALQGDLI